MPFPAFLGRGRGAPVFLLVEAGEGAIEEVDEERAREEADAVRARPEVEAVRARAEAEAVRVIEDVEVVRETEVPATGTRLPRL